MITNLQIYLIKYILVTRYIFFLHGVLTKMNQVEYYFQNPRLERLLNNSLNKSKI